jgi:hypothetical protein
MVDQALTATLQERMEDQHEQEWRREGVPEQDIAFSRASAIDARDIRSLREFTGRGLLIVVRCPKLTARPWHGILAPKPRFTQEKTGSSGVAAAKGKLFVSDYDLMGVWSSGVKGFEKIFMSAPGGASRGRRSPEAAAVLAELNLCLVSPIQHGCQDDYESPKNSGVKEGDHFAAFRMGTAEHLANMFACGQCYARNGLSWPYDLNGRYIGRAEMG